MPDMADSMSGTPGKSLAKTGSCSVYEGRTPAPQQPVFHKRRSQEVLATGYASTKIITNDIRHPATTQPSISAKSVSHREWSLKRHGRPDKSFNNLALSCGGINGNYVQSDASRSTQLDLEHSKCTADKQALTSKNAHRTQHKLSQVGMPYEEQIKRGHALCRRRFQVPRGVQPSFYYSKHMEDSKACRSNGLELPRIGTEQDSLQSAVTLTHTQEMKKEISSIIQTKRSFRLRPSYRVAKLRYGV